MDEEKHMDDEIMDRRLDRWMNKRTKGWMDVWMGNRWTDE